MNKKQKQARILEAIEKIEVGSFEFACHALGYDVMSEQLEAMRKERDEAREELENWKASGIHSCHDECKRPLCVANRKIKAMREAIKEARELLLSLEYEGNEKSTRCISCGSHCSEPHKEGCNMLSALAKLKPFLKP